MERMNETIAIGTVDRISFDFGVEFLVSGAVARIEAPSLMTDGYGTDFQFDPELSLSLIHI